MTTGSHDVVIVSEAPAGTDVVAVGMAAAASGAVSKIETVRAWTPSEFKGIAEKAGRLASAYRLADPWRMRAAIAALQFETRPSSGLSPPRA
jgi:hypothetical protein